jgi:hypothetical protein
MVEEALQAMVEEALQAMVEELLQAGRGHNPPTAASEGTPRPITPEQGARGLASLSGPRRSRKCFAHEQSLR